MRARRPWVLFVAGLVGCFLALMAWSVQRTATGVSPVVPEYAGERP